MTTLPKLRHWFFLPIACCASEQATLDLEQRLINTYQPPLNMPFIKRLMSQCITPMPKSYSHFTFRSVLPAP